MHSEKIRIGLVAKNQLHAGGASSYETSIIRYLQSIPSANIDFVVFQPSGSDSHENFGDVCEYNNGLPSEVTSIIRSTYLGQITARIFKAFMGNLEKSFAIHNIDIAYFLSPNPLSLGLINTPMINTVWDLGHRDLPEYKEMASATRYAKREFYYSKVLPKSILVVTDSQTTKSRIEQLYNVPSHHVVDAGLFPYVKNSENTPEHHSFTDSGEYLIYPAQFWPHKNHDLVIELMIEVKKKFPNLKLYLTGSDKGEMSRIRRLIQSSHLEDSIKILGFVDSETLTRLIKDASALVFPSKLGPTNLPPLESLILGTPVVVTNVNSNLMHNPENGIWVVEDNSLDQFIAAVSWILQNPLILQPISFEEENLEAASMIVKKISSIFSRSNK
jgi:glycosyltransferase involved in cell wall biosynthesis